MKTRGQGPLRLPQDFHRISFEKSNKHSIKLEKSIKTFVKLTNVLLNLQISTNYINQTEESIMTIGIIINGVICIW